MMVQRRKNDVSSAKDNRIDNVEECRYKYSQEHSREHSFFLTSPRMPAAFMPANGSNNIPNIPITV